MAKQQPKVKNTASIVMFSGTIEINGKVHQLNGVDYHRTEYENGLVVESGKPGGLSSETGVGDVIEHALSLLRQPDPPPARKKRRARRK